VAWYLATWLDADATDAMADRLTRDAGVTRLGPGRDVEVVRRGRYLFVLNRSGAAAVVPASGTDLLTGREAAGSVTVPAGNAAVIREDA
jgi:beta-galactosidase